MTNRFEIFRGREINGELTHLRICGYAFQEDDQKYYRIKLFLLTDQTYYLSKNQGPGYTIYSKMAQADDGKVTFQNPVGYGHLMDRVRTHLYLKFPDLFSHMFMSLFPVENVKAA